MRLWNLETEMKRFLLLPILLLCSLALAQNMRGKATLYGEVRDCFNKESAQGIDVYVYPADSTIAKRLDKMEEIKGGGAAAGMQDYLDSITVLFREIKRTKPLAHALTDAKGSYRFTGLPIEKPLVLLGIVDRKDEPVSYIYKKIEELGPFEQKYSLNMSGDEKCPK